MANPASTEEVTDSFRDDKPPWESLVGVDRVCVVFGEAHLMQSEQTSFLISRVEVDPLSVTSHTCTSLHIYLARILDVPLKTSLSLYS